MNIKGARFRPWAEKKSRFRVEMIFGTDYARIVNVTANLYMDIPLDGSDIGSTITEANVAEHFKDVTEAMLQVGFVGAGDKAECVTFPEGTTREQTHSA